MAEDEGALRKRYQELEVLEGQTWASAKKVQAKVDSLNERIWRLRDELVPLAAERQRLLAPLYDIKREQTSILKRMDTSVRGAELTRKKK